MADESPSRAERVAGSPGPGAPPPRGPSAARVALALGSLLALTIVAYGPTLGYGFVWDDHAQILRNDQIREWSSLADYWTRDVMQLSYDEEEVRSNYYRPLFFTQYLLYYKAFGPKPGGWHAMAVLVHFLAGAAALLFMRRLGCSLELAWVIALLFVVHPVHGESVSWIAAAFNDPPAAMLILLGLAAHATWIRRGGHARLAGGALAYAAALCMKESALAVIVLIPVVDGWLDGRRSWLRVGLRYVPFAVLTGAYLALGRAVDLAIAGPEGPDGWLAALVAHPHALFLGQLLPMTALLWAVYRGRVGRSVGGPRAFTGFAPYFAITLTYFHVRRLAIGFMFGFPFEELPDLTPTLPALALYYLRFLVWPFGLAPSYPLRYVDGWASSAAWGGMLALLALCGALAFVTRRHRFLQASCLFVAAAVWPAFNISSFRETYLVHQRYLYLACLGVCAACGWLLFRACKDRRIRFGLLGALLLVWTMSQQLYNPAWKSDTALWSRVAEVDPANSAAFDFLGREALERGSVEQAAELFSRSIAADPDQPLGYHNLALLQHTRLQDCASALDNYRKAHERFERGSRAAQKWSVEEYVYSRVNYGTCLATLGRAHEALEVFLETFATYGSAPAAENAAILLRGGGQLDAALDVLRRGFERNPDHAGLLDKLVQLHLERGETAAAAPYAERLRRLRPDAPALRGYDHSRSPGGSNFRGEGR